MAKDPEDLIERLLDCALEATFPASDPVSISSALTDPTPRAPACEAP